MVRVGIAHPSSSSIEVLRRAIEALPAHVVTFTTRDADDAVRRANGDAVGVLLVGMELAGAPVAAMVKRVVTSTRTAVLLVRASRTEHIEEVYDAMEAGAVDVIDMPSLDASGAIQGLSPLVRKLSLAARLGGLRGSNPDVPTPATNPGQSVVLPTTRKGIPAAPVQRGHAPALVAIGASTGGPEAISRVLGSLPRPFPAAIVLVQHVDESFAPTIASWFAQSSGFPVSIARDGDRLAVGEALLAGSSDHIRVDSDARLWYVAEPKDYPYRPSVDVFFESVAQHHRGTAVGVLLTGMGRDGAKGMMAMRRAGHRTIAQDERSSIIYGMPRAAIETGAAVEVLDVDRIGGAIDRAIRIGASLR